MKKSLNIIFDIDGLICDPWTRTEKFWKEHSYVPDTLKNFSFERDATDFEMTNIDKRLRSTILKSLCRPEHYRNPTSMPIATTKHGFYEHYRPTFTEWCDLFNELNDHKIMLHTHCLTPRSAEARTEWFNEVIAPASPHVSLKIDTGENKSASECDLLFEDSIANISRSPAPCRCLIEQFHNSCKSEYNRNIYHNIKNRDFVIIENNFNDYKTAVRAAIAFINADTTTTPHIESFLSAFKDMKRNDIKAGRFY